MWPFEWYRKMVVPDADAMTRRRFLVLAAWVAGWLAVAVGMFLLMAQLWH